MLHSDNRYGYDKTQQPVKYSRIKWKQGKCETDTRENSSKEKDLVQNQDRTNSNVLRKFRMRQDFAMETGAKSGRRILKREIHMNLLMKRR